MKKRRWICLALTAALTFGMLAQVLCRKEKNNPLHVGEPGVGKTALAYGLAARIEAGNVPERLAGFRIYELDLGSPRRSRRQSRRSLRAGLSDSWHD